MISQEGNDGCWAIYDWSIISNYTSSIDYKLLFRCGALYILCFPPVVLFCCCCFALLLFLLVVLFQVQEQILDLLDWSFHVLAIFLIVLLWICYWISVGNIWLWQKDVPLSCCLSSSEIWDSNFVLLHGAFINSGIDNWYLVHFELALLKLYGNGMLVLWLCCLVIRKLGTSIWYWAFY